MGAATRGAVSAVVACFVFVLGAARPAGAAAQPPGEARAEALMRSGADAFGRGDYAAAERHWEAAERAYAAAGDVDGRLGAWLNLAAVRQRVGHSKAVIETLGAALDLACESGRADKLVVIYNALGVAYTFTRRPAAADWSLETARQLLEERGGDDAAKAGVRVNLGNLHATWAESAAADERAARYATAFAHFDAAAALAKRAGDPALEAKALANAALSAARAGRSAEADRLAARAADVLRTLPDSMEKVNLLVTTGQADAALLATSAGRLAASEGGRVRRRAFDGYEQARLAAARMGNPLAASYAVGYQGRLYETAGRYADALDLTRRAVRLAQQAQSPDSLYLWEWQVGRIHRASGDREAAIAALTRARDTVDLVRDDLALGYGNAGVMGTFRSEVGPLYYELADLLLARADAASDPAAAGRDLVAARDTVERLRVGELQSYLQDKCVEQAKQGGRVDLATDLAKVGGGRPAVVYVIPLRDRIEVLLTTRAGVTRGTAAGVGADRLTREVRAFRSRLEEGGAYEYWSGARQLYDWLIRPVESALEAEQIDTLVFVPDGALRTIPMAALSPDGETYLVDRYAVAVSPGLTLQLSPGDRGRAPDGAGVAAAAAEMAARVLACGLSVEPRSQTSARALPNVKGELQAIQDIMGGQSEVKLLLDEDFVADHFKRELGATVEGHSIVHIASHGTFMADAEDTFVLAYDRKLSLGEIEDLLRPHRLRGRPVSLLTLSACETSAGDDEAARERASLGMGGLAVKAGARTAVASLWCAHDAATRELMTRFYAELARNPRAGKAQALRHAQRSLAAGPPSFAHPIYWAPFLVIGDWM